MLSSISFNIITKEKRKKEKNNSIRRVVCCNPHPLQRDTHSFWGFVQPVLVLQHLGDPWNLYQKAR